MSSQITVARVQQYKAEVMHLSQQKGSRLQDRVRRESQQGKSAFYDRLGAAAAIEKTSRHSDTPQIDSEHSRRRVTLKDYVWADLIDEEDLRRLLMDPAGKYAEAAMWAMGRVKDDRIIYAANNSAWGGEDGSTEVSLGNSQKLAAVQSGPAFDDANVAWLRGIKSIFDSNDVDESIMRHAAITSSQLQALLGETEVTSADFNTIRALVMGEIETYMGFKFVRTERLDTQVDALSASTSTGAVGSGDTVVGHRRCVFWAQDGLLLATAEDTKVRIEPRSDKNYSTQVHVTMGIGTTRMEEAKVVIGLALES